MEFTHANIPATVNPNPNSGALSSHQDLVRDMPSRSSTNSTPWRKPEVGMFKAHNDASLTHYGRWGIGAIIRNEEGLVMMTATWIVSGWKDPLMVEAFGMLTTMRFAKEGGFRHMIFESDSNILIRKMKYGDGDDRSYFGDIIQEIRKEQSNFDTCIFNFTPRSGNKVAHQLAQLAHTEPNMVWMEEVLEATTSLYFQDLIH